MANNPLSTSKRSNANGQADIQSIPAIKFNKNAGGDKVLKVGPAFVNLGPLNILTSVPPGSIVYCYNNSSSVAWVTFGDSTLTAPGTWSFTTGIPLPPNQYTALSAADNTYMIASAATVGGYQVIDESNLR